MLYDLGKRVTPKTDDGLYIIVNEQPTASYDQAMLTSMNVDPRKMQVIIQKSHQLFKEGFRNVMGSSLYADTEAFTDRNIPRFPFKNVARPLYPLDDIPSTEAPTQ